MGAGRLAVPAIPRAVRIIISHVAGGARARGSRVSSAAEYHDIETQVRSCYATWSTDYYRDYYESSKAYPPVHTDIVRQELSAAKAKTVIDAGCGPASM